MKNEECTITTSREYPTCLALIRHGALNEKINEEKPIHVITLSNE